MYMHCTVQHALIVSFDSHYYGYTTTAISAAASLAHCIRTSSHAHAHVHALLLALTPFVRASCITSRLVLNHTETFYTITSLNRRSGVLNLVLPLSVHEENRRTSAKPFTKVKGT